MRSAVAMQRISSHARSSVSCRGFPKSTRTWLYAVAGVILFFTCASAVLAPLAIGAVSDALGQIEYGFSLATGFAALLFIGALLNWLLNPTRVVLERLEVTEYRQDATA
jgi:fucose permease